MVSKRIYGTRKPKYVKTFDIKQYEINDFLENKPTMFNTYLPET
jgi:hypothetical protein